MQQIPAQPAVTKLKPDIRIDLGIPEPAASGDTTKVLVKELKFTGANTIAEVELLRVSGFVPSRQLSVAELRAMAVKITAHYRGLGYFLAQTFLPAQDITEGVVRFTVMEGQYGQIRLHNRSGLSDGVANAILNGLKNADAVTTSALERRILMLSDLPGISAKTTLAPGGTIGTSLCASAHTGYRYHATIRPYESLSGCAAADRPLGPLARASPTFLVRRNHRHWHLC